MRAKQRTSRVTVIALLALGACSSQQPPARGTDAGVSQASTTSCGVPDATIACCADGVTSGSSCTADGLDCWSSCIGGMSSRMACGSGEWSFTGALTACAEPGTVACDDGTGQLDCCPDGVAEGAPCDGTATQGCWTKCQKNSRALFACSGGTWLIGKGVFSCGLVDAGSAD